MKNFQLSKILTTAVFAVTTLSLGGCNRGPQEEENRFIIQNIKIHTIQWHFENKCIAILNVEESSLQQINQVNGLSVVDRDELRGLVARYMIAEIQSKINHQSVLMLHYRCTLFGEKTLLNPSMIDIVKNSKSLLIADKNELLRKLPTEKN